jgi:hypothetical protein
LKNQFCFNLERLGKQVVKMAAIGPKGLALSGGCHISWFAVLGHGDGRRNGQWAVALSREVAEKGL